MLNEIFSWLDGGIVVHKIALLNKRVRENLKKLKPFADFRIVTLETVDDSDYDYDKEFRIRRNSAYKSLMKFTNNLRLRITDENYLDFYSVVEFIENEQRFTFIPKILHADYGLRKLMRKTFTKYLKIMNSFLLQLNTITITS